MKDLGRSFINFGGTVIGIVNNIESRPGGAEVINEFLLPRIVGPGAV